MEKILNIVSDEGELKLNSIQCVDNVGERFEQTEYNDSKKYQNDVMMVEASESEVMSEKNERVLKRKEAEEEKCNDASKNDEYEPSYKKNLNFKDTDGT